MTLRTRPLQAPSLLFAGGSEHASALKGLRSAGPFDQGTCPSEPRLLFVFPKESRDNANRLFLALRNGVGPFAGASPLFRFGVEKDRVVGVSDFTVQGLAHEAAARAYLDAAKAFLSKTVDAFDCAFIIHGKTSDSVAGNPYLTTKFPLLARNIPSQVVTEDLLHSEGTFQWSAANVALAAFAKMGGKPWAVSSRLSEDSIILGVGRAEVPVAGGATKERHYGIATAFSHEGVYRGMDLFPVQEGWDAYLGGLKSALAATLARWREHVGRPVDLIMHVERIAVTDEEVEALKECLAKSPDETVRSYAVVRLSRAEDYLFADDVDSDYVPPAARMIALGRDLALVQIGGKSPSAELGRHFMAGPWLVHRLAHSDAAPPLEALCQHVLSMSSINWRALNADAVPVSIQYPQLVARLLGRFGAAGFDISALAGLSVLDKAWFL